MEQHKEGEAKHTARRNGTIRVSVPLAAVTHIGTGPRRCPQLAAPAGNAATESLQQAAPAPALKSNIPLAVHATHGDVLVGATPRGLGVRLRQGRRGGKDGSPVVEGSVTAAVGVTTVGDQAREPTTIG